MNSLDNTHGKGVKFEFPRVGQVELEEGNEAKGLLGENARRFLWKIREHTSKRIFLMYAIIQTGGKQYRVSPGDVVKVEKLDGNVGDTVTFENVLMIGGEKEPIIGSPVVKGASVTGTITEQDKAKKITILKFKRRKGYRRKMGHRQPFTRLRIEKITNK